MYARDTLHKYICVYIPKTLCIYMEKMKCSFIYGLVEDEITSPIRLTASKQSQIRLFFLTKFDFYMAIKFTSAALGIMRVQLRVPINISVHSVVILEGFRGPAITGTHDTKSRSTLCNFSSCNSLQQPFAGTNQKRSSTQLSI